MKEIPETGASFKHAPAEPGSRRAGVPVIRVRGHVAALVPPGLIILLAATVRFFRIGHWSLWYDELYTVWASRLPLKSLLKEVMASGHPPLYYLAGHVWFGLASGGVWVRLVSWGSGVGIVVLVYLIGRQLFSRSARLWATAMAALSPVLIWYSRDATSYSWVAFLSTLSFYFLIRSAKNGGWLDWSGFTLTAVGVSLSYYFAPILIISGWPAYWILRNRQTSSARRWLGCQAGLVLTNAILMLTVRSGTAPHWLVITKPDLASLFKGAAEAPLTLTGGGWIADDLNYKGAVFGQSFAVMSGLALTAVAAILAFVLVPRGMRRRLGSRQFLALAIYGFGLVGGPLLLETMLARLPTVRYYLWGAPILLLLAGALIAAIPRKTGLVLGCAVLAAFAGFSIYEMNWNDNLDGNWRAVMATISAGEHPGDVMLCLPVHMCTVASSFYQSNPPPIVGGFPLIGAAAVYPLPKGAAWGGYLSGYYTGMGRPPALSGPALDQWLSTLLAGARRVWLINSDNDASSPQVMQDLKEHWRLEHKWQYASQPLRLYGPEPDSGH